jgi:hypothetical protein
MARSEAAVSADALLRYDELGWRLWRNNSGTLLDKRGVPVRFGLGNTSPEVNARLKSPDYVGWRPLLITPDMVGDVVAQFCGVEFKHEGWRLALPTDRARYAHEQAQERFLAMVRADGGYGEFCSGL